MTRLPTPLQLEVLTAWASSPIQWLNAQTVRWSMVGKDWVELPILRKRLDSLTRRGFLESAVKWSETHYRPTPLVDELKEKGLLP